MTRPEQLLRLDVAAWEGAIRLEHGAEYEFRGENGLQVFLDDQLMEGKQYFNLKMTQDQQKPSLAIMAQKKKHSRIKSHVPLTLVQLFFL